MRYRVVIPYWYEGILTTEEIGGKEIVIHAPSVMAWAVGKDIRDALAYYRSRPSATIEPVESGKPQKKKVVVKRKRVIRVVRRRKDE